MSRDAKLSELTREVQSFCEARDWDQFHGPKDLAIGVVTEASELLALFRFLSEREAGDLLSDPAKKLAVEEEVADVLFFILRFAQRFDVDLPAALKRKLERNAARYPIEKARGKNRKYTEL